MTHSCLGKDTTSQIPPISFTRPSAKLPPNLFISQFNTMKITIVIAFAPSASGYHCSNGVPKSLYRCILKHMLVSLQLSVENSPCLHYAFIESRSV